MKKERNHKSTNRPFHDWPDSPIKRLVERELRDLANEFEQIISRYESTGTSDLSLFIQDRDQVFKDEIAILMAQRGLTPKHTNND